MNLAPESYSVSCPGSLMLLGEHAVLANKPAMVCAINKRLTVKLTPTASNEININSKNLGKMTLSIKSLKDINSDKNFEYVLAAIQVFANSLPSGFNLEVDSEFGIVGFGSSAAITIATIAVLARWMFQKPIAQKQIFKLGLSVITKVKGIGSGADLAASLYGGVLYYQSYGKKLKRLSALPDITAVYCGYKQPSYEVVRLVQQNTQNNPRLYNKIFKAQHGCVSNALKAIKAKNWSKLGQVFNQHNSLQVALGVSDAVLDEINIKLRNDPHIFGSKISGSGLGDCVIALGALKEKLFKEQFVLTNDPNGVIYAN